MTDMPGMNAPTLEYSEVPNFPSVQTPEKALLGMNCKYWGASFYTGNTEGQCVDSVHPSEWTQSLASPATV